MIPHCVKSAFLRPTFYVLLLSLFVSLNSPLAQPQPPQYFAGTGHWYQIIQIPAFSMTWTECRDSAAAVGGYLASILSTGEQSFICGLGMPTVASAVGGFEPNDDGNWKWVSGEPWGFTNWDPGEPNDTEHPQYGSEDYLCVYTDRPGCTWNDTWDVFQFSSFIVEYDGNPCSAESAPQYFAGTGHWYQLVLPCPFICWEDAKADAESRGGYLASVHSDAENSFILSLMPGLPSSYAGIFIGGQAPDGQGNNSSLYTWLSGEPWTYTNWMNGEPSTETDESKVEIFYESSIRHGKWNNSQNCPIVSCAYVVEYDNNCASGALEFDGQDLVSVPDNSSLDLDPGESMTVEFWFYPSGGQNTYHLIGKRTDCGTLPNYQIGYSSGSVFWGSANDAAYSFTPPQNTWTHAAGVYDGTTFKLFINGDSVAASAGTPQPPNSAPLYFGASSDPTCERLIGRMDEVRIWNIARSRTEIAENLDRVIDPNTLGLVGYWRFDESDPDQTVFDLSAQANHGTLGASTSIGGDDPTRALSSAPLVACSTFTTCAVHALRFDGVNDEVDIPHASSLSFGASDHLTIELWFNLAEPRSVYHLMSKRVGCGDYNYHLAVGSGELHFATGSNPAFRVGTPFTATVGQWNHVAATCDGSAVQLYLNGHLMATGSGSLGNTNTEPLRIGQSGICGDDQRFIGMIDEVRVWNVARSESEISADYSHSVSPASPGLVGYWNFDESLSRQDVLDLSPSGNNGTLGADSATASDDPTRVLSSVPINACSSACQCLCWADPQCDSIRSDVLDVIQTINVAFRGTPATLDPTCPNDRSDVNCSGATDVIDVVKVVNVAFRGINPATEFCNPCP